jgi:hypothetical protein
MPAVSGPRNCTILAISGHRIRNPKLLIQKNKNMSSKVVDSEELKCDVCIFKTTDKIRFERHKFENHSVKGKYKCIQCLQEFEKRKYFNHHNFKGCNSPED